MEPAPIETITREEHEFQVMLWVEGTAWRSAWREPHGRHWHGVQSRHASAEAAREAACSVALRSRPRRSAASPGQAASTGSGDDAPALRHEALSDSWTAAYSSWRAAQDQLEHTPPDNLGEFMHLRAEVDRLQRQLDRFTSLALRRTARGRRGAHPGRTAEEMATDRRDRQS